MTLYKFTIDCTNNNSRMMNFYRIYHVIANNRPSADAAIETMINFDEHRKIGSHFKIDCMEVVLKEDYFIIPGGCGA